ncbi:MAG TPA: DNA-3-methyladenine glycosylase [Trebonia sp.]|nr:DNA-3-methyladenine glycosylase [Trebonia sp.]
MLTRGFFDRPGPEVAPDLLGYVLEHETADGVVAVMLSEVEAYAGSIDPASHSYRGKTGRNAVMFGPPGHAYVYFTYGMHFCANVVCSPPDVATGILLRAGRVVAGEELVRRRRGFDSARSPRDLARGPARLCQAMGINRSQDGVDLLDPSSELRLRAAVGDERAAEPVKIEAGPRVGVSQAADIPWRFWLAGDPTVSPYRRAVARRKTPQTTVAPPLPTSECPR